MAWADESRSGSMLIGRAIDLFPRRQKIGAKLSRADLPWRIMRPGWIRSAPRLQSHLNLQDAAIFAELKGKMRRYHQASPQSHFTLGRI